MKYSILIVGVGGQGVITLSRIIAIAGKLSGYDVIGLENKGGAQRGGKASSLIRLSRGVPTSSISIRMTPGGIDMVLSMDLFETIRYLNWYSEQTVVVSDKQMIIPPLARNETGDSLDYQKLLNILKDLSLRVYLENFYDLAMEYTGNLINTNLILLGWLMGRDLIPISHECFREAAVQVVGDSGAAIIECALKQMKTIQ